MPTMTLLVALAVVITTTAGATSDVNVGIMISVFSIYGHTINLSDWDWQNRQTVRENDTQKDLSGNGQSLQRADNSGRRQYMGSTA